MPEVPSELCTWVLARTKPTTDLVEQSMVGQMIQSNDDEDAQVVPAARLGSPGWLRDLGVPQAMRGM